LALFPCRGQTEEGNEGLNKTIWIPMFEFEMFSIH